MKITIFRIPHRLETTKKHVLILMGQRSRSTEFSVKTSKDKDNIDKIDSRAVCGGEFFRTNRRKNDQSKEQRELNGFDEK